MRSRYYSTAPFCHSLPSMAPQNRAFRECSVPVHSWLHLAFLVFLRASVAPQIRKKHSFSEPVQYRLKPGYKLCL